jgi:hypothetical protein
MSLVRPLRLRTPVLGLRGSAEVSPRATPQQKKALIRLLVKELRVMSRKGIRATYKTPALVRASKGQVVPTGFESVSPS